MSGLRIASNQPVTIKKLLAVEIDGDPTLIFDWENWGHYFTALGFSVVNRGAVDVTVTPEVSPDGEHVATAGLGVANAVVVPAGAASLDPYGVDLMVPFWRLWISSEGGLATTCDVYVFGIPRTGGRVP